MFRLIILVVAVVAGIGAAWIAWNMRGEPPAAVASAVAVTHDVLVAATEVSQGQALTKESMRWQAWPEPMLQPGYIVRSARADATTSLAGLVARGIIAAGEPIREEKLWPAGNGLLSSMLRPGKRAVAVHVTAANSAGGFILPNDRVDVLHTVASLDRPDGQKDYTTRTILTNITVLAIDQSLDDKNKDDKGKAKPSTVGKTATLELDSRQAEKLTAAEASGSLSLALRSSADHADFTPPSTVTQASLQPVIVLRGASNGSGAAKTQ